MVIILVDRFVPEFGMYREYRVSPRTEKSTEDETSTPSTRCLVNLWARLPFEATLFAV
jgi:hypothetical protein